ncbi:hypothetical protein BC826DRAFT_1043231 [Russula brevipes]|nr:hypothetical protein BC826DRAFT_1043231 [Russula brevipes]
MEFAEHAIWLMKGCVGQCLCKYCTPGQNQRHINRRLNRDRQRLAVGAPRVRRGVARGVRSATGRRPLWRRIIGSAARPEA